MKKKIIFAVVIFVMGFVLVSPCQTVVKKNNVVDYETLAKRLVNQCAIIHEGEFVLITGGVKNLELLEDIAVNVRKLGAFPLLTIGSDRMTRLSYTDVPAKYDTQVPELELKMFNFLTAVISVDYNEKPDLLADIPYDRIVAREKASAPVSELVINRNVKGVNLGNELYPTEARAKQLGFTLQELSDIFWNGVNVDYSKLEAKGNALKTILSGGKEVHITNANGTDLKMHIENRQAYVSDGVLTPENVKKGIAGSQAYLPAGEVFLSPVPGTAEGKVVVNYQFFQGKEIDGLTMTFKEGKLTSMTAKSGLEPLKAYYDAAGTGKEEFAYIDLGINPNVVLKPNGKSGAWVPAGMITVGIGNSQWSGGENKVPFNLTFFLPGSTLKVDGKALVENGVLMK